MGLPLSSATRLAATSRNGRDCLRLAYSCLNGPGSSRFSRVGVACGGEDDFKSGAELFHMTGKTPLGHTVRGGGGSGRFSASGAFKDSGTFLDFRSENADTILIRRVLMGKKGRHDCRHDQRVGRRQGVEDQVWLRQIPRHSRKRQGNRRCRRQRQPRHHDERFDSPLRRVFRPGSLRRRQHTRLVPPREEGPHVCAYSDVRRS